MPEHHDEQVEREAVLSDDGTYRYLLTRSWCDDDNAVTFVMLNPSTADANVDDPTIRRCMGFARSWGYGGIVVVNLYALRATDPKALWAHEAPVGPENAQYLTDVLDTAARFCAPVVAAWGAHAKPMRVEAFKQIVRRTGASLESLGVTKAGAPKHPLYLAANTERRIWPGADSDA